jgi:stress-induced morphogen
MATIIGRGTDNALECLKGALEEYETNHPGAEAKLYRQNSASIRLRVIDRRFEGMTKSRRHADVWQFLASRLPEDTLSEISLLLAIAPAELGMSLANFEFDNPTPSRL